MHEKKVRPLRIWQTNVPTQTVVKATTLIWVAESPSMPMPSGESQTLHLWNVLATLNPSSDQLELTNGLDVGIDLWADELQTLWVASLFIAAYGPPSKFAAAVGSNGMAMFPGGTVDIGARGSGDNPLVELPDLIMVGGNAIGPGAYPRWASVFVAAGVRNADAINDHTMDCQLTIAWSLEE